MGFYLSASAGLSKHVIGKQMRGLHNCDKNEPPQRYEGQVNSSVVGVDVDTEQISIGINAYFYP